MNADYEIELTKANRLKIAGAFRFNKRVDFSIECAVEGQLGRVYVDDPAQPTAYCLRVGPFGYFAGDASSAAARKLMASFPAYHLLMPSPAEWLELAQEIFGERLVSLPRYSFSSARLSAEHLGQLLSRSRFRDRIVPISLDLVVQAAGQPESFLDLSDFDSAADFVARGFGYTVLDGGEMIGAAYSSLVCSHGIEVSVYVEERRRQRGVATALCSRLLLDCLALGMRPNWDAANTESVRLARKLGYVFVEAYDAYFYHDDRAQ
jgi:GNAT superfamily N-acetyltransferase